MAVLCRLCNRPNPPEAAYCYHDGSVLPGAMGHGAQNLAQAPFPLPFTFPSGAVCQNFDQLALTCHSRWQETGELLRNGTLPRFLGQIGRVDLQHAATQAAAEADRDYGIDWFIARLPARNLAAPKLAVVPERHDLGAVRPGHDYHFDLHLRNDGHRLIVGSITSECAWLEAEGAAAGQPRLIQFADAQTLRIRVVGDKLAAASKPREGKLLIVTNGGSAEIPVTCTVPVIPFPAGVLKGCRSPRDVAMKAKALPAEAADLFCRGQVQEWYKSNGWVYPVRGTPASGTAAVQQFFEALGVVKAPRVELETHALGFQGTPGSRLEQKLYLRSADGRPVYAFARSPSPWLTVTEQASDGARASITVVVNVPHDTFGQLRTHLEIHANGNQRFQVPVVVRIDPAPAMTPAAVVAVPIAAPAPPAAAVEQHPGGRNCCLTTAVLGIGLLLLGGVSAAAVALVLWAPDLFARSPLERYPYAVGPKTCIVAEVNLQALEAHPGLGAESTQLREQLAAYIHDLSLQPPGGRRDGPQRLFVAISNGELPLMVLTFGDPVQLGDAPAGHYETTKQPRLCIDQLDRGRAWGVDGLGRLIGGPVAAVRAALDREKSRQKSRAYEALIQASRKVSPDAVAWGAGDFAGGGKETLVPFLGAETPRVQLQHFAIELAPHSPEVLVLRGTGAFPSLADATSGSDIIRGLPSNAMPLLPASLDISKVVREASWEINGTDLRAARNVTVQVPASVMHLASAALVGANEQTRRTLGELARKESEAGKAAHDRGDYAEAMEIFQRVVKRFPQDDEARQRFSSARKMLEERQAYDRGIATGRDALAKGELDAARKALDRIKKSPCVNDEYTALTKKLAVEERLTQFRGRLKDARAQVGSGHFEKACDLYKQASALEPTDAVAKRECAAAHLLIDARRVIQKSAELLAAHQLDAARRELHSGLDKLRADGAGVWREEPLKGQRDRLLKQGITDCRSIYDAVASAAAESGKHGMVLAATGMFADAEKELKQAQEQWAHARSLLQDLERLGGEAAAIADKQRTVDAAVDQLRKHEVVVRTKTLFAQGTEALNKATAAVAEARSDPQLIRPAMARLDEASKALRDADKLSTGIAAKQLGAVEALRQRLGRLEHPVTLDVAKGLTKPDWRFDKRKWQVHKDRNGKQWLQSDAKEPVALESARSDWPVDFELAIDFALVDGRGDINNEHWAYHADPLTIRLVSRAGNDVVIALGNDASYTLDKIARLEVNRRATVVEGFLPTEQPIHLVLRCTRSKPEARPSMSAELNGRRICSVDVARDMEGVHLRVANAAEARIPRFVAIFGLDVRLARDKTKEPASPASP